MFAPEPSTCITVTDSEWRPVTVKLTPATARSLTLMVSTCPEGSAKMQVTAVPP